MTAVQAPEVALDLPLTLSADCQLKDATSKSHFVTPSTKADRALLSLNDDEDLRNNKSQKKQAGGRDTDASPAQPLADAMSVLSEPNSLHQADLKRSFFARPHNPSHVKTQVDTATPHDSSDEAEKDSTADSKGLKRKRKYIEEDLSDVLRSPQGRRADRGLHLIEPLEL